MLLIRNSVPVFPELQVFPVPVGQERALALLPLEL
jgi:hypothetical protein